MRAATDRLSLQTRRWRSPVNAHASLRTQTLAPCPLPFGSPHRSILANRENANRLHAPRFISSQLWTRMQESVTPFYARAVSADPSHLRHTGRSLRLTPSQSRPGELQAASTVTAASNQLSLMKLELVQQHFCPGRAGPGRASVRAKLRRRSAGTVIPGPM